VSADQPSQSDDTLAAVDHIYGTESRRVFATLVRLLGDFDRAEDALHEAFRAALEQWPRDGVPAHPRAWLVSAGRFKLIDAMRRDVRFDGLDDEQDFVDPNTLDGITLDDDAVEDDRLRLIFTCCHPALAPDVQVTLTLREVCGLTTEEIAHAFLAPAPTLAQRIASEKNRLHKLLADAGIRLNVVVSDIHGQAARAMVKALIEGQSQNNNKRPVLAMHQRMTIAENGTWSSMREWVGVGQQVIARETVEWDQEHMRVSAYVNGLEEFSSVAVRSGSSGVSLDTQLRATPTKGQTREWRLNVPFTSVSLSSLPFLIAKHWPALMAGQVLYASYLVLKVQRAATVRIARKVGHLEGSQVVIEVAPTNVVLRFIFGTTTMQFVGDSPNLARMDGLLDLRDMRRNGQWRGVSRHPGISSTLRFERFCWC